MIAGQRCLVVFAVLALVAGGARGAPTAEPAREHYKKGLALYNVADYAGALAEFKAAYLGKQDPAFLFNIGQCQRQLAQYEAAAKSYRAFLRESDASLPAATRAETQRLIAAMDKAYQEEQAKQPPTGTREPAAEEPREGPAGVVAQEARSPAPSRKLMIAGAAVGAAGLALGGLGVGFAVLAKQAGDEAYRPANNIYDPAADDRQRSFQAGEIACFVLGGAAVVAGVTLIALGAGKRSARVHAWVRP
jgi:tetratricopeptide (TPR) repeat protein